VVKPSCRKIIAKWAVNQKQISIRLACVTFNISQICYRYNELQKDENAKIVELLIDLTDCHKRWGFGLCFLYLRNVLGFGWNHKRVYRNYRELELNLRIKPRKRLILKKPDKLRVPEMANDTWSMDLWLINLAMVGNFVHSMF
jgi:putative transposase